MFLSWVILPSFVHKEADSPHTVDPERLSWSDCPIDPAMKVAPLRDIVLIEHLPIVSGDDIKDPRPAPGFSSSASTLPLHLLTTSFLVLRPGAFLRPLIFTIHIPSKMLAKYVVCFFALAAFVNAAPVVDYRMSRLFLNHFISLMT